MSKQVDERIVEMRFENSKFEKNVSQTMKTLDKLQEKLGFKNAGDGFDNLEKKANKVSFEHLVNSVDKLSDTISHRTGIMGGIFEELGSRIVSIFDGAFSKVQNMINAVTLEPIETGFSEYELKINSVQTIAANTGVLMRDVFAEMDDSAESVVDTFNALEIAWDVMQGAYGNGAARVEALGDRYDKVQSLVNQIVRGEIKMGDVIDDATESIEEQEYTMKDIEKVLDDLNTYADKTIYNYAHMTDAIGKFTVAGVDLYDSASAVQGISNLGAFVGANAADTSRIMRELAQGLSTGIINLQDWKSLENSSGFAGTVFQDHLVDMADHLYATNDAYREYIQSMHGDIGSVKNLVNYYGKFRNSLTEGAWLTGDVLINTLHEFAGDWGDEMYEALGYTEQEIADLQALGQVAFEAATKSKTFTQMWDAVTEAAQSSWTTTWEYIFGHFYDARNLWTIIGDTLSNIIESNNEARNEVLRVWSNTGGRDKFFSGIAHIFNFFMNIASSVKEAWNALFPPMSGKMLTKYSYQFDRFAASLEKMEGFYTIAKSLGTVIFTLLKAGVIVLESFLSLLGFSFGTSMNGSIIDNVEVMALNLEMLVTTFIDLDTIGGRATEFFSKFLDIIKKIPIFLLSIAVGVDEFSKEFLGFSIIDTIKMVVSMIPNVAAKVKSGFGMIEPLILSIKDLFSFTKKNGGVMDTVKEMFSGFNINLDNDSVKNITTIAGGLAQLFLVFQGVKALKGTGKLSSVLSELPDGILSIFSAIKDAAEEVSTAAKSGIIITIAKSLLMLAAAITIMAFIPVDKLHNATATLALAMVGVTVMFKVLSGVIGSFPNGTVLRGASAMAILAVSIGILVSSIAILSVLDPASAVISLGIIAVIMKLIQNLINVFNHARFRNNVPSVAGAIFIITQAISSLGMLIAVLSFVVKYNTGGVIGATILVAAIFGALIGIATLIRKFPFTINAKKTLGVVTSIAVIAGVVAAIGLLIVALSTFMTLNPGGMWHAFGMVSAILIMIVAIAALLNVTMMIPNINPVGLLATAGSMVLIVGAIASIAAVLMILSAIQNDKVGAAFLTLTGIVGLIILMIPVLGSVKPDRVLSIIAVAFAINLMTMAILLMAEGLMLLSSIDFDAKKVFSVTVGLTVAIGALIALAAIMGGLMSAMSGSGNTVNRTFNVMFGNTSPIHRFLQGIALLLLSISVSLWLVVDAINRIMNAADRFNGDKQMTKKLANMFKGLADAFANSWSYIVEAVDKAGFSDTMEKWFQSIIDHLLKALAYLLAGIATFADVLAYSLVDVFIQLMNGFAGTDLDEMVKAFDGEGPIENLMERFVENVKNSPIERFLNNLVALIAMIIYALGDAILNNAAPIVMAIYHVLEALGYLILTIFVAISSLFIPDFDMTNLGEAVDDLNENWAEYWMDSFNTYILPALTKMGKAILVGLVDIVTLPFVGVAKLLVEGINFFINNGVDSINSAFGTNLKRVDTSWFDDFYGDFYTKIHNWIGDINDENESVSKTIDITSESMQNFTNQLDTLAGKNVEAKVAIDTSGLENKLFDAGNSAGRESIKGFNKAWEIHSPSEEGEESGEYIGQGVINGITRYVNSSEAKEKLLGMKDTLSDANIWSSLFDPASSEFSLEPSQVFNLNTDNMGDDLMASGFGDTFSEMSMNMGTVSTDLAGVNSYTQDISEALANEGGKFYDDSDVISELSGLRTDITSLSHAMAQIKMYLDTNKLVGELVVPIDNALAQRASRVQRTG